MPRNNVYYAVLVRRERCNSYSTIRFFTGYRRKAMREALQRLAEPGKTLQSGTWSINAADGHTLEAHTFWSLRSSRWNTVPRVMHQCYDITKGWMAMAKTNCDTINNDGTITENGI
jgi:hypothetical protein